MSAIKHGALTKSPELDKCGARKVPDEEMAASSLEGSRAHLKFAVGLGPPPPTSSSEDCEGRIVRCWICAHPATAVSLSLTASDYQC